MHMQLTFNFLPKIPSIAGNRAEHNHLHFPLIPPSLAPQPSNAHDVSELELPAGGAAPGACRVAPLGAALYGPLSLFNHSCGRADMGWTGLSGDNMYCSSAFVGRPPMSKRMLDRTARLAQRIKKRS